MIRDYYIVQFGHSSRGEFSNWPEALRCCIENHTPEVSNPDEVDGADDSSWRAQHGLTEAQERDLIEAGLL